MPTSGPITVREGSGSCGLEFGHQGQRVGKHHKRVCITFVNKGKDSEYLIPQDVFRLGALLSVPSELFLQWK